MPALLGIGMSILEYIMYSDAHISKLKKSKSSNSNNIN